LAAFLLAISQHGRYEGARVIDSATVDSMFTPQFPDIRTSQGLVWYTLDVAGHTTWSHSAWTAGEHDHELLSGKRSGCDRSDQRRQISIDFNILYHLFTWAGEDADFDDISTWMICARFPRPAILMSMATGSAMTATTVREPNQWQEDTDGTASGMPASCVARAGGKHRRARGDEPTLSDIMALVDVLFISQDPDHIACMAEADINQSSLRVVPDLSTSLCLIS